MPVALRAASILKNRDFLKINYLPFCARRPAGGLDLEKSLILGNKLIAVWLQLSCQSLDLVILSQLDAESRLETPWSPSYDPSEFDWGYTSG